MSYEVFQTRVKCLLSRVNMTALFTQDEYNGKYIAICDDGTQIIGNSVSMKVTVKFGSGHQAMAAI